MKFKFLLLFLINCSLLLAKERTTSYPFLAGDTWRFYCDWVLGESPTLEAEKVKQGDTIFVEVDSLQNFSQNYLPHIQYQFILITPNTDNGGDNPQPGPFDDLRNDNKLAAWFLQNIDRDACDKLFPIPIGIANTTYVHGNISNLDHYINIALTKPIAERSTFAYVNFTDNTNPHERTPCRHYFNQQPWVTIRFPGNHSDYLADLANAKFVVSPRGNGLDTHRTWEALLMGCYPIVKSSYLNPLYEDLPVVIVNEWQEVTEALLEQKLSEFSSQNFLRDKLYAEYWFQKVEEVQAALRTSQRHNLNTTQPSGITSL